MDYLKVNKFRIRIEVNAPLLFNLWEHDETRVNKEMIVAYGITLFKALKIIARYDVAQEDIAGWREWMTAYEARMVSLSEKLLNLDGKLSAYLDAHTKRTTMSDEHRRKIKEGREKWKADAKVT